MRSGRSVIPWKFFTGFFKFHGIVCVNNLWLLWRFEEFSWTLFRLLWSFCFTRIRLNPLSGKILYHDSVSMIVPWFTFLIEDFVISRYQVTKLLCSSYCFASESSAKSSRNCGSQAYLAISVFWEVSEDAVLPWLWYHFRRTLRIWVLRNVCGHRHFNVH